MRSEHSSAPRRSPRAALSHCAQLLIHKAAMRAVPTSEDTPTVTTARQLLRVYIPKKLLPPPEIMPDDPAAERRAERINSILGACVVGGTASAILFGVIGIGETQAPAAPSIVQEDTPTSQPHSIFPTPLIQPTTTPEQSNAVTWHTPTPPAGQTS